MPEPLPPIDYSSRDWVSLRSDLIDAKRRRMPEWTSESPNDFGIVLIELFAYVGDMLSFYADRVANEAFLDTAVLRSSVLSIARMLDYRPTGLQAAKTRLSFLTPDIAGAVTIPAGTRVQTIAEPGQQPIMFETDTEIIIPGGGGSHVGEVDATQGLGVVGEIVGNSDGSNYQRFPLFRSPVVDGTAVVTVTESAAPLEWAFFEHILDAGPNDPAFATFTDDGGIMWIEFGDDVNGRVPVSGAEIKVSYRTADGSAGNVAVGLVNQLTIPIVIDGITQPVQSVTNVVVAAGGADPESLDSIRQNAPRSLTAINRAVTTDDYAALARRLQGVGKAQATATGTTAITVRIAPLNNPGGTATGRHEVQTVTITGGPTGGTFTLTFQGQTTAALDWNANSAAVQAALEALDALNPGDVIVAGGPFPGTSMTVTFAQSWGYRDVAAMTGNGALLTGGTTPGVTVAETTKGIVGVKGAVYNYLEPRKMIGVTVTIADPSYTEVDVTADIVVLSTYKRETVKQAVQSSLADIFSFARVDFGKRITLSRVYQAIYGTEGVDYGTVSTLGAAPSTPGTAADVPMTNSQIPVAGTITVNATGGII